MSIEYLLAQLTEGTNFQVERLDQGAIQCPIEEVAGTLGAIARGIAHRKSKRSAAMPSEFGLDLLITKGTGNVSSKVRDKTIRRCATLAWALFWEEPANDSAKVTKALFNRVGEVALNDHCDPGHYHGISPNAMAKEIKVDRKTWLRWLEPIYGQLKSEMSRAEYPVIEEFWRLYHGREL